MKTVERELCSRLRKSLLIKYHWPFATELRDGPISTYVGRVKYQFQVAMSCCKGDNLPMHILF